VNKVRMLGKARPFRRHPRDKRVTGESGSLANEPCVPVGRANWGRQELGRAMLAANLLHQLDKPTGGTTKVPSVFRDLDLQVAGRPMALSAIETPASSSIW